MSAPNATFPPPAHPTVRPTGKRLFIGLVLGAACLLCVALGILWLIPARGFASIHPWLPTITAVVFFLGMCCVAWISAGLVFHALTGRPFFGSSRMRGLSVRLFLPLAEMLGRAVGCSPEEVRRSFIKVNNELILSSDQRCPPDKVLILLPHCLQASACPHRLSHNPDNCGRCGKCAYAGLLRLRDAWGIQLAVATGGTIARRIVVQARPRLIIAVACERDLAAGIQDTYPLPVYGILNERPHGPCLDTALNLDKVEAALRAFVRPLPPLQDVAS
jgi:hypothetical protein